MTLKAPFPYFGGKSTVADLVWRRLGNVRNYIEPFCGSAAVLLRRPGEPGIETVNDIDCYVANFWRATQWAPDEVAEHADWPVNEADLHARHVWLVRGVESDAFRASMHADPMYFDPRIAGWWAWGQSCWIGGGWCSDGVGWEQTPGTGEAGQGVYKKRIKLSGNGIGNGVHRKRPSLGDGNGSGSAKAVNGSVPELAGDGGAAGRGVCASAGGRPQLADQYSRGRGVHGNDGASRCQARRAWLTEWFGRLRDRLRSVRVCCGRWDRVCGSRSITTRIGMTGVFLDPPYSAETGRDMGLYGSESGDVAHAVRDWCLEHGADPRMRIVLCGYAGEHDDLERHGWSVEAWKAHGGYGNRNADNDRKHKERLWLSPHCLHARQPTLF